MKKRIWTAVLVLVLVLSLGLITANAAEVKASGTCGPGLSYTLTTDGTLTISGTGAMNDYSYSKSAPWYAYRGSTHTVIIREGVTSIGNYAFKDHAAITSLSLPSTLISLGNNSFYSCKGLTEVVLPDSVTFVGEGAFYFCRGITKLTLSKNLMQYNKNAFSYLSITSLEIPEGVTNTGNSAFSDCEELEQVKLPSTLTTIGNRTFYSADKLETLEIPDSVNSIGEYAFAFSALTTVRIPDGVTSIPDSCFHYCSDLVTIEIPASVTSIHEDAFTNCRELKTVYFYGTEAQWSNLATSRELKNAQVIYVTAGTCSHIQSYTQAAVEPTCTETGLTEGTFCPMCNSAVVPQEVIPALGHAYGPWTMITEPTKETTGLRTRVCDTCNEEEEEEIPVLSNPFTDVAAGKFYYDPILWAYSHKVTAGMTATTFAPDSTCTRGQVVTFLWRAAGSPAPKTTENPFTDVIAGKFYYDAVLWAAENGITAGTSDTTFEPNKTVTRSQFVTFLWRAAGEEEIESNAPFVDLKQKAFYYKAVLWATAKGYCTGVGDAKFSPDGNCTRGQTVTFLHRYYADTPVTAPSAIALSHQHMYLTDYRHDTYTLSGTVMPEAAEGSEITFTSSNPAVATVSPDGYLVPVSKGTATITAKCGNAVSYCTVEVPNVDKGWFAFRIHEYINDNFILNSQTNPRIITYETSEGHLVVYGTVFIKVLTNGGFWKDEFYSIAYDLTDNKDIHQPDDYYNKMADRYWGASRLHYMDLAIEYSQLQLNYYDFTEYYEKADGWWVPVE